MPAEDELPPERGLHDHVALLRRRYLTILLVTAAFAAGALGLSLTQEKRYRSTAEVLFQQEPVSLQDPAADQRVEEQRLDPERVIENEVQIATGSSVREAVVEAVGPPVEISARASLDSDVILISATSTDPQRASEVAGAAADAYIEHARRRATARAEASIAAIEDRLAATEAELARAESPAERVALQDQRARWQQDLAEAQAEAALAGAGAPELLTPASTPSSPFQPATERNLVLGLVSGVAAGLAAAYVIDRLDDRVTTSDSLRLATGLPVLGSTKEVRIPSLQLLAPDDPRLAGPEIDLLLAEVAEAAGSRDARILAVPSGTPARKAHEACRLLEETGIPLVGVLLVDAAPSEHGEVSSSSEPVAAARS